MGGYIDSIRFTMSNGDVSPKYGSMPFTNSCGFDSRITKIKASCKDNRLVGLIFYTEHDGEYSRDALAGPLREPADLLTKVRCKTFLPDAARS